MKKPTDHRQAQFQTMAKRLSRQYAALWEQYWNTEDCDVRTRLVCRVRRVHALREHVRARRALAF